MGLAERKALLAFLAGLAVIAVAIGFIAARSRLWPLAAELTPANATVVNVPPGARACQVRVGLAKDTAALKLFPQLTGPARARLEPDRQMPGPWRTLRPATAAALPLAMRMRHDAVATVCIANAGPASLRLLGTQTGPDSQVRLSGSAHGNGIGGVRFDDLTAAHDVSAASMIARLPGRMVGAVGSKLAPWLAIGGPLVALIAVALLIAGGARTPRLELALVVVVGLAMGAAWAGFTPAFQETDEPQHFAYVQTVSELGHPPRQLRDTGLFSGELTCWYNGLFVPRVRWDLTARPNWSSTGTDALDRSCAGASRKYDGAQYHSFQPPAYYLLGAIPYDVGSGLALPTRLLFVRLLSVLLVAVAVAATFLLVREVLPEAIWPGRAAAFALAFEPVFVFNDVAVNPDSLVVAVAALIALAAARIWRSGLTLARAVTLGALIGLGLVTKANFLAVVPGVCVLGLALLLAGGRGRVSRRLLPLAAGALVALAFLALYALVNHVAWHRALTYRQAALSAQGGTVSGFLHYAWHFFTQPGLRTSPFFQFLVKGAIGRLGWWNDFGIASVWIDLVLAGVALIIVTAAVYVVPRARRRPWPLVTAVSSGAIFLLALVYADYRYSLGSGGSSFEARYIFPALPLWGVTVACAVAAIPVRRRGLAVGLLSAAFVAHTAVAVVTMIGRYYV